LKFRDLTKEERTAMNRAFDRWGVFDFFKDKILLIAENTSKSVCLLTTELYPVALRLGPEHAGLTLGILRKGFTPSMAGADIFARQATRKDRYVTVNENAEQLVLYGRDVMGDSITSASDSLDENELVIIVNGLQEAIGIGRTRFAGKGILQRGRITVTTVADAGKYLRDEG
jgi:predicted RNA-binding protein (TIGR00451 family)